MKSLATKISIIWISVIFINLFVIKATAVGPVILTISDNHGWGVHTFDLIVFPLTLIAMIFSVLMLVNFKKVNI